MPDESVCGTSRCAEDGVNRFSSRDPLKGSQSMNRFPTAGTTKILQSLYTHQCALVGNGFSICPTLWNGQQTYIIIIAIIPYCFSALQETMVESHSKRMDTVLGRRTCDPRCLSVVSLKCLFSYIFRPKSAIGNMAKWTGEGDLKRRVIHFFKPRGRACRKVWITNAASSRNIGGWATSHSSECLAHPLPSMCYYC